MCINIKRHPPYTGVFADKHATFRHVVTEGPSEDDRKIALDRCAKINWPLALLKNSERDDVFYWQNNRQNGVGHILAISDFSYKIVLVERVIGLKRFLLLWTAFPIQGRNQIEKNRKEYEKYIAQNS